MQYGDTWDAAGDAGNWKPRYRMLESPRYFPPFCVAYHFITELRPDDHRGNRKPPYRMLDLWISLIVHSYIIACIVAPCDE